MAYIEWNEKFSVQVKEMDDQHKKLFDLINGFYDALTAHQAKEGLGRLLDGLLEYTIFHFAHEERLMRRFRYEGQEAQEAAHRAFTQKVADVRTRFTEGKLVLSLEITGFLKSWLTEHIMASDRKYAECFMANAMK